MPVGLADLVLVGHTESMEYVGRVPAPPLDQFIDDIYCLTGVPRHRRLTVPPMPSAHLMINLGGPVRLHDSHAAMPPSRDAARSSATTWAVTSVSDGE